MGFWDSVKLELIKTLLIFLTLGFSYIIGQKIINYWDIKKKRQELAMETASLFHKLYGEFKEVSRLWRAFCYKVKHGQAEDYPQNTRIDLLRRATHAEGGIEAIIVKLATERILEDDHIETLGLFRQAYQKLREAIRNGEPLEWTYNTPEYDIYNNLASKTAWIITSDTGDKMPEQAEAVKKLQEITTFRSKDWDSAVQKRHSSLKVKEA